MMTGPHVPDDLALMLDQLAHTIVTTLGFEVAMINLVRADGLVEVASMAGHESARAALLGTTASAETWEEYLSATEPADRLRFLDPVRHRPATASTWRPRDAVFVPLRAADGSTLGILGVVVGNDQSMPDATTRNALEALGVSAALAIEHATLRSRAEASERTLLHQAMSDPLTGVGTRTLLLERLRHASTARPESSAAMALVFIDLDGFKAINDLHNHAVGDQVLRTVAERIQTAVRAHDTVARWGGDEFLVLLHPLADEHSALGAVQRVLATVAEPVVEGGLTLAVTASIGVSFWTSDAQVEAEELVRRADAAMYEAKRNGGDCFAVYDALDTQSSRRLHLQELAARAVAEDRVVVQYQPIVRVADRRVVGVEALLRLRDDDGTLVHPTELQHAASPPGDLAREVMHRAGADVARWVGQGHDLWLSVDVGAQHVADIDGFVSDVSKALASAGLSADRLTVEMTENTLLNTTTRTLMGIEDLVASGIRFSIDDFGAGFGAMTSLRVMPVHELKIDCSFVADASSHPTATAIIRSIASLARELGIRCVAQGVERPAHHELVCETGVPLAQGAYYSSVLDASEVEAMLDSDRRADVH